jgi:hypothetical protein
MEYMSALAALGGASEKITAALTALAVHIPGRTQIVPDLIEKPGRAHDEASHVVSLPRLRLCCQRRSHQSFDGVVGLE